MLKGIIFDLDGTLISVHVDGAAFRREIANELAHSGFKMDLIEARYKGLYVQDILDLAKTQIEEGIVDVDYHGLRARTFRALDNLELEWITHSMLMPGAASILSRLRGEGQVPITLALLTNSGRAATEYALNKLGLGKFFETSFSRDDLPVMKPRPEGITAALKELRLQGDEVLYVGDSPTDIMASRAAGVRIASVATGKYDFAALKKLGPDYTLASLSELEALLAKIA